jgi:hypothetical protein
MVGVVAGVKARRMSKEHPSTPGSGSSLSQGPFSSLFSACSISMCSNAQTGDGPNFLLERAASSKENQELLRAKQQQAEAEHLRTLINAQPLPQDGRRPSKNSDMFGGRSWRNSDMTEKSVSSDDLAWAAAA